MTLTEHEFVHLYELDPELVEELLRTGTSLKDLAQIIESSALGADFVTSNDKISHPTSLLIEQYALMISDAELTENITNALTKFRKWLFKFSPELARL